MLLVSAMKPKRVAALSASGGRKSLCGVAELIQLSGYRRGIRTVCGLGRDAPPL